MDIYKMKYKLQLNNFSLYQMEQHTDYNKLFITKNEHGTYDEFYDYSIVLKIDVITKYILDYSILKQNDDYNILKIKNIFENNVNCKTTIYDFCDIICNLI